LHDKINVKKTILKIKETRKFENLGRFGSINNGFNCILTIGKRFATNEIAWNLVKKKYLRSLVTEAEVVVVDVVVGGKGQVIFNTLFVKFQRY
jgi:hypothetical protein